MTYKAEGTAIKDPHGGLVCFVSDPYVAGMLIEHLNRVFGHEFTYRPASRRHPVEQAMYAEGFQDGYKEGRKQLGKEIPRFPQESRKMWTGGEVQKWVEENWPKP